MCVHTLSEEKPVHDIDEDMIMWLMDGSSADSLRREDFGNVASSGGGQCNDVEVRWGHTWVYSAYTHICIYNIRDVIYIC